MNKYYAVIRFNSNSKTPGKVVIWPTYDGHTWGGSIYEVLGYGDSHREAQQLARSFKNRR